MTCLHHYTMCHSVSVSLAAGMRGLTGTGIPKVLPLLCVTPYLSYASLHLSVCSSSVRLSSPPTRPPPLPFSRQLCCSATRLTISSWPLMPSQWEGLLSRHPTRLSQSTRMVRRAPSFHGAAGNLGGHTPSLEHSAYCNFSPCHQGVLAVSIFLSPTMSVPSSSPSCLSYAWLTSLAQKTFNLQLCRFCNSAASGGVGVGVGAGIPCWFFCCPKRWALIL